MTKHYWTVGSGLIEGEPDFQGIMDGELDMMISYLRQWCKWRECQRGRHTWSDWNGNAESNKGGILVRCCNNCGLEMPESRKGEKNYIDIKMRGEKEIEKAKELIKRYENM